MSAPDSLHSLLRPAGLVLLLWTAGILPAPAQTSALPKPLRKFDQDKNGKLIDEELVQARQAHNRGGREPEINPNRWKEMMERRRGQWFRENQTRLDLDKDGSLNGAETAKAEEAWKETADGFAAIQTALTRQFDRNDDGDLTREERQASRRESEKQRTELEKSILQKFFPEVPRAQTAPPSPAPVAAPPAPAAPGTQPG